SNDYLNSSESAQNVALDYSLAITEDINLDLHAGYSFGDYWDGIRDFNDYKDYSVGLSSSVAGLDVSIAYLMNSMDKADEISHGEFSNDDTVLLTISRTF
ncbi:MAG: TorF family putative porin, partial [Colwellia sp.]